MHFILEDPSKAKLTEGEKKLQVFQIHSQAAVVSYRLRFNLNAGALKSSRTSSERQYFQYYCERTSVSCSGWEDYFFWTSTLPRLAASYPSISKTLSALGACHRALETRDRDLATYSISLGKQALRTLNDNHSKVHLAIVAAQCVVATALSALLNDSVWRQAARLQYDFADAGYDDEHGIIDLIKQNRSHWCQFLDPLYCLRTATLQPCNPRIEGLRTLRDARDTLKQVLNKVAREAQLRQPVDTILLAKWRNAFAALQSKENYVSWLALRAAYGMSLVQIETLYTDNEMVYDKYIDVYMDVPDVMELALSQERPAMRFGLDSGVCLFLRWAFKWCRSPPLRQRMLSVVRKVELMEEVVGSILDAARCEAIQKVEEAGLSGPLSCAGDIPETNRVRWVGLAYFGKQKLQRLDYVRSPYTGAPESVWVSLPWQEVQLHEAYMVEKTEDFVFGPGFRATRQPDGTFWRLNSSEFYFVIPKVG